MRWLSRGQGIPQRPRLLWFGREVLQSHGWTVLQVVDTWDRSIDAESWANDRLDAALRYLGPRSRRLVLAKSLTTLTATKVAELDYPGIWLTPLLNREAVRSGLRATKAPSLIIGGSADPTWDPVIVANLPHIDSIEIAGADHALQIPGNPAASVSALQQTVAAIDQFLPKLD